MNPQSSKICLNPQCPEPFRRLIDQNQKNTELPHQACSQWVLQYEDLFNRKFNAELQENTSFNVSAFPVQSLMSFNGITDYEPIIHGIYESLRQQCIKKLNEGESQALKRFNYLKKLSSDALQQVFSFIVEYGKKSNINNSQFLHSFHEFTSISRIEILNTHRAQFLYMNKISPSIEQFNQSVVSMSSFAEQFENLKKERRSKFLEFINKEDVAINEKLQGLSKLYKIQLNRAKFDEANGCYKVNCWICKSPVMGPKTNEMNKMEETEIQIGLTPRQLIYKLLLEHIRSQHESEIETVYSAKVLRSHLFEINIKNIVKQIQPFINNLKQIWIIDRENSGTFEMPEKYLHDIFSSENQNYFYVDVVNKENKNLAKSPYLVAGSSKKDAADILISLLVYEIIKETNLKAILVTNDHFGSALGDIIVNVFGNRFETLKVSEAVKRV